MKNRFRSNVRRAAGLLIGWCALVSAVTFGTLHVQHRAWLVAGAAVGAGVAVILLIRGILRMPCRGCGLDLYRSMRSAIRGDSPLDACPQCGARIDDQAATKGFRA